MADDHNSVEWLTKSVEGIIVRYETTGVDPSTKTVIFDFPTVTPEEREVLLRRFAGRIGLILGLEGLAACHKPLTFPNVPVARKV